MAPLKMRLLSPGGVAAALGILMHYRVHTGSSAGRALPENKIRDF